MAEVQRTISGREFAEWLAYYQIEPWGEERADLRAGIVASTVANVHRTKSQKAYKPEDFVPKFKVPEKEPDRQTWEEQLMIVEMLNEAFGGRDLRNKPPEVA